MEIIKLREEFIKLGQALKAAGLVESGVEAKEVIQEGLVMVNGEVDTRRGRKLYAGDQVVFDGEEIKLKIESLKLKNFRNYELLSLGFDKSTNIFYGDNAQGKTNILEAVYLSGTTKSHRGTKDKDMIQFGANESHIETIVEKNGIKYQIDMHLKKNSPKGIAINKIPIRKASELFGIINIVFFSPEDLNIIKNGPGERRRFIDLELSQLDKVYLNNLSNYNRIVNQRNHLLKEIDYNKGALETLDIWDIQLIQYGNKIIERRQKFIEEINKIISNIHKKLTGNREDIKIVYEPSNGALSLNRPC